MDKIYEAAAKYIALEQYEYEFVLSKSRRKVVLYVDFNDEDFFHLTGMQYLNDIDIPRNRKKTLDNILAKHTITDSLLEKSRVYMQSTRDKNIKGRIEELRFLEEYLDTDNIIRVFAVHNRGDVNSNINADYIIESKLKGNSYSVYIFLKHRRENPNVCGVVSFFIKDKIAYGGEIMYWLQKKKKILSTGKELVLQQHKNYKEKDK